MDFEPHRHSWLSGYLRHSYPALDYIDCYFNDEPLTARGGRLCLIYLDEEDPSVFGRIQQSTTPQQIIAVYKTDAMRQQLDSLGIRSVFFPYWVIIDDIMAIKYLQIRSMRFNEPVHKHNFFCLNRNPHYHRLQTIETLAQHNLLEHGYVTWQGDALLHLPQLYRPHIPHYVDTTTGFERHNHWIDDIGFSSNVANYWMIQQCIHAPINLSVETKLEPFHPSEKSFLAFFTKRVPLVLASPGRMAELRNQGFDIFDDLMDHSYDAEDDPDRRIYRCIHDNRDILKCFDTDVTARCEYNHRYLMEDWFDMTINQLHLQIDQYL